MTPSKGLNASRIALILVLLVMVGSLLACVGITSTSTDTTGREPSTAVEPMNWLQIPGTMAILTSSLQEDVEVSSGSFGLPPEEGYHYIFVGVGVYCYEGARGGMCNIDSGNFTLFGDNAIVYEEREDIITVPEHLGTIVPDSLGDVIGFNHGRTEIPAGRTRDAVLIFVTREGDGNYVLSYRESYYWQVPDAVEGVDEATGLEDVGE